MTTHNRPTWLPAAAALLAGYVAYGVAYWLAFPVALIAFLVVACWIEEVW